MKEAAILENQLSFDLSELQGNPFDPTAEPGYPYLSSSFREALAALYYGLEYGSRILVLTADRGLGKTTLLRHFEDRMHDRSRTLFLSPSHDKGVEVLRKLLAEIGRTDPGDDLLAMWTQVDEILTRVAEADNPFILLLDYGENAAESALETLRCLTSLESFERRLLRIVIAGPPDIAEKLQGSALADEVRRVPLAPLTAAEVESYIDYRLRLAGWRGGRPFTAKACGLIAEGSSGKPYAINEICFNLLQNPAERDNSPSDNAAWNKDSISDESDVALVTPDRRASVLALADLLSRRTAALACTALVLVLGVGSLWYGIPIKKRAARHVTAEITMPLAALLHYAGIHDGRPKQWQNPAHAVATTRATGKSVTGNPAAATVSEPAGDREAARLSPAASPAASAVLSATSGKTTTDDSVAVNPTSAVPPAISSLSTTAVVPNAGAHPVETVAKQDQKDISAPLSQIKVSAQLSTSSPIPQPAPPQARATPPAAIRKLAVTAKGERAARVADEVAAYEIRLGDRYMNVGEYDYALSSFSRAIAFSPGNKEAEEKLERARRAKAAEANILQ
jgi:type II secretory pathway predicted ATPase ExeA